MESVSQAPLERSAERWKPRPYGLPGTVLTALVLLLLTAAPARADVSRRDVELAEEAVEEAEARLGAERTRYEEALRVEIALHDDLRQIADELAGRERELKEAQSQAHDRIARMYISAGTSAEAITLLGVGDLSDLPTRVGYLGAVVEQDRAFRNWLESIHADFERLQQRLDEALGVQRRETADLRALVDSRVEELEAARSRYRKVAIQWERQEEERRRREAEEERRRREAEAAARRAAEAARRAAAQAALLGGNAQQWRPLIEAYFPPEAVDAAMVIMYCESRGNPASTNPWTGAAGLFQHLQQYWPGRAAAAGFSGASVYDPEANIAAAALLYNSQGWRPWTCKP
ncbi:MAG: transglycosylase SLT domain-containing protein [Acidimicrobiia bacterium]